MFYIIAYGAVSYQQEDKAQLANALWSYWKFSAAIVLDDSVKSLHQHILSPNTIVIISNVTRFV